MEENELYHYGVLGMKWGVRRTPEQLGHKTHKKQGTKTFVEKTSASTSSKNKSQESNKKKEEDPFVVKNRAAQNISKDLSKVVKLLEEHERGSQAKARSKLKSKQLEKAGELSNKELQEIIQRMSLENQYSELTSSRMSIGKSYVDEILSGVGEGLGVVGSILGILASAKMLIGK